MVSLPAGFARTLARVHGTHAAVAGAVLAAAVLATGTGFDLDPFDSAELALAAVTAGLGHPPGQPVHTMLGWLATRGPWPPLPALAWLSLAPAAVLFALCARHGAGRVGTANPRSLAGLAAITVPAVLAALLPSVREAVCRVEVYALGAALAGAAVLVAGHRRARSDLAAGLLVALAGCTNPVLGVQAMGAVWLAWRAPAGWRWRALARGLAGVAVGVLCYLYAYGVRGRATSTMVWAAPHDLPSLFALWSGQDFAPNRVLTAAVFAANVARVLRDLARSGVLLWLALGAAGLMVRLPANDPRAAGSPRDTQPSARSEITLPFVLALLVGVALVATNVPYRAANPDYGGYYLVPLALATGGIARLLAARRAPRVVASLLALVLGCSLVALLARGRPTGASRELATAVLREAPPGALAVIASDHLFFPALYLQRVEGLRPDVTLLNPGWASSGWAWRYAMARDPSLRVDLRPGIGRVARLVGALRARTPGRAVLAEDLALIAAVAQGPVCPRSVLWASSEGCPRERRALRESGLELVRAIRARSRAGSWDAQIARYTALALGHQARGLGCAALARRYYRAGLGLATPAHVALCGEPPRGAPATVGLLEITDADLSRAIADAR